MEFEEARRILRRLELPNGGFEELLLQLDELKDRAPVDQAALRRRPLPKLARPRGSRAA